MTTTTAPLSPFMGFSQADFDVFSIEGLEPRMDALIERIRPKLHQLGSRIAPMLSVQCGEEMFAYVARHARRTINAPNDTWVAFANNKRGYKAHPHFQIGLFGSHLFAQFAIIYESDNKAVFAKHALDKLDQLHRLIPSHYVWSGNHMVPGGTAQGELQPGELQALLQRLQSVKASEALCGIIIDRNDPLLTQGEQLIETIEHTFATLMPLYRIAF